MSSTPVLDARVLHQLGSDLGDPAALRNYVDRYVDMLRTRIDRLHAALRTRDPAGFQEAALSLQSASRMIGASALAGCTTELMQRLAPATSSTIRWLDSQELAVCVCDLQRLARETALLLDRFLHPTH